MFKLVREDDAYEAFVRDPAGELRANGINPDRVDQAMFADLAKRLRERITGVGVLDRIADQAQTSETNNHESTNWNHEAGSYSEKSRGSYVGETHQFEASGQPITPDQMLRHELGLIFFPAQPLVVPQLIDKIRREAEQEEHP
jgi:hypothetical protein